MAAGMLRPLASRGIASLLGRYGATCASRALPVGELSLCMVQPASLGASSFASRGVSPFGDLLRQPVALCAPGSIAGFALRSPAGALLPQPLAELHLRAFSAAAAAAAKAKPKTPRKASPASTTKAKAGKTAAKGASKASGKASSKPSAAAAKKKQAVKAKGKAAPRAAPAARKGSGRPRSLDIVKEKDMAQKEAAKAVKAQARQLARARAAAEKAEAAAKAAKARMQAKLRREQQKQREVEKKVAAKAKAKAKEEARVKRAPSAYVLFAGPRIAALRKEGCALADASKKAGEDWKAMSAEQKAPYEAEAAKGKAAVGELRAKAKEAFKAKRATTAYFHYSRERYPVLKEQHPDKKLTEIMVLLAAEWRGMSEEQKRKYVEAEEAEREAKGLPSLEGRRRVPRPRKAKAAPVPKAEAAGGNTTAGAV